MVLLPSVTSKRTLRSALRTTLPSLTRPPSRMREPAGIFFSTTSVGELKKTIESFSAPSTSATATASTPSDEPINARRRCLRVMAPFPKLVPDSVVGVRQSRAAPDDTVFGIEGHQQLWLVSLRVRAL